MTEIEKVMGMSLFACIDIGGTAIKYGAADIDGRFVKTCSLPNPIRKCGKEGLADSLTEIVKGLQTEYEIKGVAVSTAGIVDAEKGKISYAIPTTFPGYSGFDLADMFSERCGLPCTVENDVNCAVLGEWWLGAGKGTGSLVGITVGTGVGGGILFDGKIWHGVADIGGSVGWMKLGDETFEELVSVARLIKEAAAVSGISVDELDGRRIFALAKSGDEKLMNLIERQMSFLAEGIGNICYLLSPEMVVVGGGIMEDRDFLEPVLKKALDEKIEPAVRKNIRTEFARLGNRAGMAGALCNFLQRLNMIYLGGQKDGSKNS